MSRFAMFPKRRRMMTCRQVGEKLQAYLDSEVDELTMLRIAHHLEGCRRCGMERDVYTQIKASLQRHGGDVETDAMERLRSFSQQLMSVPHTQPENTDEAPDD